MNDWLGNRGKAADRILRLPLRASSLAVPRRREDLAFGFTTGPAFSPVPIP
jgi:hypothetical protein